MGNLSNLYISQSFQSLIHLGNDNTASATLVELEDGYGNGIGIAVNTSGDLYLSGSLTASLQEGNVLVGNGNGRTYNVPTSSFINNSSFNTFTQSFNEFTQSTNEYTASNNSKWANLDSVSGSWITESETASFAKTDVSNIFTADQTIQGTLNVDIINATTIHTIIESSSIVFSSGSNILGDSILDTQTLNGTIIVSGSEQVTGSLGITGDFSGGGNGTFIGNISSSTVSGIGNVTTYSASVETKISASNAAFNAYTASTNSRLNNLEIKSASVDISISNLNSFTSSQNTKNTTLATYTASVDASASLWNTKWNTLSTYTASNDTKWTTLQSVTSSFSSSINQINSVTASLNAYTASNDTKWTTLGSLSGSFARTNTSNNFTGSNTFSGSIITTGSVQGNIVPLIITSQTASMDLSKGNFFTITLVSGSATRLNAINIVPGQTINLLVNQAVTASTLTFTPNQFYWPLGNGYTASLVSSAKDILTFISFDTASLYSSYIKTLS